MIIVFSDNCLTIRLTFPALNAESDLNEQMRAANPQQHPKQHRQEIREMVKELLGFIGTSGGLTTVG